MHYLPRVMAEQVGILLEGVTVYGDLREESISYNQNAYCEGLYLN